MRDASSPLNSPLLSPLAAPLAAPLASPLASRRRWLAEAGSGLGMLALGSLLAGDDGSGTSSGTSGEASGGTRGGTRDQASEKASHFPARAKRIIWLFMHGGPSHVDLFDPKPELSALAGQPLPASFGPVMTRRKVAENPLLPAVKPFRPHGESGLQISDFLPEIARHADELAVIRSMHGDSVNHPQSVYQMNTGSILMGRPSVGSWLAYGLGAESSDLPAFVVLPDPGGGVKGGPPAWGSGFLPATFQGVTMRGGDSPILHLRGAEPVPPERRQATIDLLRELNRRHQQRRDDDELSARIRAYELAFRMQATAPELVDMRSESVETERVYGLEQKECAEFGRRCLLARRLIERGVRFVQVYSGDTNGWDAHNDLPKNHEQLCRTTDLPIAGLLTDLKRRGLWNDTLVVWGGEFGRMPMSESGTGRDHNPWGYTVWLAGGGVRGGIAYGATDAVGLRAEENRVAVRDLHATLLHLLGLDFRQLTFHHHGLDERLTGPSDDVRVVREILA